MCVCMSSVYHEMDASWCLDFRWYNKVSIYLHLSICNAVCVCWGRGGVVIFGFMYSKLQYLTCPLTSYCSWCGPGHSNWNGRHWPGERSLTVTSHMQLRHNSLRFQHKDHAGIVTCDLIPCMVRFHAPLIWCTELKDLFTFSLSCKRKRQLFSVLRGDSRGLCRRNLSDFFKKPQELHYWVEQSFVSNG